MSLEIGECIYVNIAAIKLCIFDYMVKSNNKKNAISSYNKSVWLICNKAKEQDEMWKKQDE